MIITQTSLQMNSQHSSVVSDRKEESVTYWQGERPGLQPNNPAGAQLVLSTQVTHSEVNLSKMAMALQPEKALMHADVKQVDEPIGDLKIQLLKLLVERFTGHEIALLRPEDVTPTGDAHKASHELEQTQQLQSSDQTQSAGWGLIYDYYASHYESEQTSFQTEGVVRTRDGREIAVSLQLNMSREFLSEQRLQIRGGDAVMKDPLVVNFNGTATQLTERNFSFDIDADGRQDQIAFVRQGSGLLSLDHNGDGSINDGSELFGALSGNGFAELASFDQDANGWIDEADSVYSRLRIWSKDAAGQDHLMALGEAGIGALYLGSVDTPFLLKDADNEALGQIKQSGLYLKEEGGVGTIQQVDLVA